MPKKRHHPSPKPQPTVHPTLQSTRSPRHGASNDQSPSVNDLIRQLRRAQVSEQPRTAPHIAPRTVHPSLRNILGLPETPPPKPREARHLGRRARRTPGPAAPASWTVRNEEVKKEDEEEELKKGEVRKIERLERLPGTSFPAQDSLTHAILKAMAMRWDYHLQYDNVFLSELPAYVKQMLLSYVARFTDHDRMEVGMKGLKPLFLDVNPETGQPEDFSDVSRLDLGNAIGRWISIRQLQKELKGPQRESNAKSVADSQKTQPSVEDAPTSWEDEVEDDIPSTVSTPVPFQLSTSPFPSLRFLSLANPNPAPSSASWPALLSLLSNLSTLTHLSLAFWPPPTLTPNSLRTRVRHPTVHSLTFQYGGTDIYSAYEGDFSEAASILRKLSRATYCLKWLDLEGCSEWIAALVFTPPDQAQGSTGPEWNASWRGIEWLSLGPGWRPGDLRDEMSDDETREARKELEKYDGLVQGARSIGKQIQGVRVQGKGRWIDVHCGEVENW